MARTRIGRQTVGLLLTATVLGAPAASEDETLPAAAALPAAPAPAFPMEPARLRLDVGAEPTLSRRALRERALSLRGDASPNLPTGGVDAAGLLDPDPDLLEPPAGLEGLEGLDAEAFRQ